MRRAWRGANVPVCVHALFIGPSDPSKMFDACEDMINMKRQWVTGSAPFRKPASTCCLDESVGGRGDENHRLEPHSCRVMRELITPLHAVNKQQGRKRERGKMGRGGGNWIRGT